MSKSLPYSSLVMLYSKKKGFSNMYQFGYLLFLIASLFCLSEANVNQNCSSTVTITGQPLQIGGIMKKGIPFPKLDSLIKLEDKENCKPKDDCFTQIKTNLPQGLSKDDQKLICALVRMNSLIDYDVHIQISMEYNCINEKEGTEFFSTKIDRTSYKGFKCPLP